MLEHGFQSQSEKELYKPQKAVILVQYCLVEPAFVNL